MMMMMMMMMMEGDGNSTFQACRYIPRNNSGKNNKKRETKIKELPDVYNKSDLPARHCWQMLEHLISSDKNIQVSINVPRGWKALSCSS